MRITEDDTHGIVFICLSSKEAKELAEDLMYHVGLKVQPRTLIEKLANQMDDLFLDPEN
jgi:hypothetical protein